MSDRQLWNQIKEDLREKVKGRLELSALNTATCKSSVWKGKKHFQLEATSPLHQKILKTLILEIEEQIKPAGLLQKKISIKTGLPAHSFSPAPHRPLLAPLRHPQKSLPQKNRRFCAEWTFSAFVEGPNNRFAFSLAQSIAKHPTKNPSNPLFLYGPSGTGKTHLLHAIGNALFKSHPQLKTLYLPAERFFNDCITHIRKKEMPAFRQKYRTQIDILLLDDIQILGRGDSTQEEFFHTFEHLKRGNCQIVLAGDQRPKNIKGLKERIKTRFEGGVIADIQAPDKDTKRAIILYKTQKENFSISPEVVSFLAHLPVTSVRALTGCINKLKIYCDLMKKPPTLSLAKAIFREEISASSPTLPGGADGNACPTSSFLPSLPFQGALPSPEARAKEIKKAVCARFQLRLADLRSPARSRKIVLARNIAIYLIRKQTKLSLTKIGQQFGNRNHTTLSHSLKQINYQQAKNKDFANNIKEIEDLILKKTAGGG